MRQTVNAKGPKGWASLVFKRALYVGALNPDGAERFRTEIKQFLEIWFESLGTPSRNVFLDDLALVFANLAAENLLHQELVGKTVWRLARDAMKSLAIGKWNATPEEDRRSVLVEDFESALWDALLDVMNEHWADVSTVNPRGLAEPDLAQIQGFEMRFNKSLSRVVAPRRGASRETGGPIAKRLAVKFKFKQSVAKHIKTQLWRRFLDKTKLDHIRCDCCKKVWEKAQLIYEEDSLDGSRATLRSGRGKWSVRLVRNQSRRLKECPKCRKRLPPGTRLPRTLDSDQPDVEEMGVEPRPLPTDQLVVSLITEISKQFAQAVDDDAINRDRDSIIRLINRENHQIKTALERLSRQQRLDPNVLSDRFELQVALPNELQPPQAVTVRVGEAFGRYLKEYGRDQLLKATKACLDEFKSPP
jgi:hypothetical protein